MSLMDQYKLIKSFLMSRFAKDGIFIVGSNIVGAGVGLLTTMILMKLLGPSQWGILAILLTMMDLIVQVSDLGINMSTLRFASRDLAEGRTAIDIFSGGLVLKILSVLALSALALIFLPVFVSNLLGHRVVNGNILYLLALVASMVLILNNFGIVVIQALERFKLMALLRVSTALGVFLGIIALSQTRSIPSILNIFIVIPAFSFGIIIFILRNAFSKWHRITEIKPALKKIRKFSFWVGGGQFLIVLFEKSPVFLMGVYLTSESIGQYVAAQKFSMGINLLITSLITILLPRASKVSSVEKIRVFVKRNLKISLILAIATFFVYIVGISVFKVIFGKEYFEAISLLYIFLPAYLISIITLPVNVVVTYSFGDPKPATVINFLQMLIALGCYIVFIPKYGVIAAAFIYTVVRIFGTVSLSLIMVNKLRDKNFANEKTGSDLG